MENVSSVYGCLPRTPGYSGALTYEFIIYDNILYRNCLLNIYTLIIRKIVEYT